VTERRFPPPWSVEEQPGYFIVRDANGQQLAYVYYESEPQRPNCLPKTRPGGLQNIAKLPELLCKKVD